MTTFFDNRATLSRSSRPAPLQCVGHWIEHRWNWWPCCPLVIVLLECCDGDLCATRWGSIFASNTSSNFATFQGACLQICANFLGTPSPAPLISPSQFWYHTFVSTVGKRAFPVSGATVWNDLLLHVASAPSLAVFWRLETFLFSRSYQDTIMCYYYHSSLLSGHLWSLQLLTLFRPR